MQHDIYATADLPDGEMRQVEAAGQKILLARLRGACHAIGATCPHAGAPLAEGVLHAGTVICPWHKAAFSLTTGRCLEPPALDDLPHYPVTESEGRISVLIGNSTSPNPVTPPDPRTMLIIGAGAAGSAAAQTLREEGFTGRIAMIGREDRLPYDRTLLSKYTLSGTQGGEKSPLQDAAFYDHHRIERLTRQVVSLDPATNTATFDDGTTMPYHAALLATGATPNRPDIPGATLPGVFLLRSAADAEAITAAAAPGRHAIIAGAGFIAMEAAASLRERGLQVTVIAPQTAPFEKQLGPHIGNAIRGLHERAGIDFRLGETITAFEGDHHIQSVRLQSGAQLPADLVIIGMGVTPETPALPGIPHRKDGGLDVDPTLRVTNTLYAAGDIAAFPLHVTGPRIRVEHWRVAQQHGRLAARNMLGQSLHYTAVPYFWTIHFKQRLDYIGHAETWDDLVIDGDLEIPDFTAFYLQQTKVVAIAAWGRDQPMARALALMTGCQDWTLDALRQAISKPPLHLVPTMPDKA